MAAMMRPSVGDKQGLFKSPIASSPTGIMFPYLVTPVSSRRSRHPVRWTFSAMQVHDTQFSDHLACICTITIPGKRGFNGRAISDIFNVTQPILLPNLQHTLHFNLRPKPQPHLPHAPSYPHILRHEHSRSESQRQQ